MKAWKGLLVLAVALALAGSFACSGGGKYGDAKDLMNKTLSAMDNFCAAMDKATEAKTVAAAINVFKEAMSALKPKMQALDKKYPELKDPAKMPEELKSYEKKLTEIGPKMMNAMMKIAQFTQDPDVQKAQETLNKVMQE